LVILLERLQTVIGRTLVIWLTGSLDLERTIIFSKEKDFQGRNTGFYCSYTTGFIICTSDSVQPEGRIAGFFRDHTVF
jgi:hypothetical protein